MSTVSTFQIVLILATLLCSLVAGFLFAFATVVMPGIKTLNDREFIRAFQVIDGVIQNNQPHDPKQSQKAIHAVLVTME